MGTLSNKVDRLDWQVPIANPNGTPTAEFQRKWVQQAKTNASIPDLTTAAAVSAVIDLLSSTVGALLVRGATQWGELAPSADGKVLRDKGAGNAPIWDTISNIVDLIGNTRGSVLYRGAAGWSVLAPSAAGKVLTDGGVGADPSWQTASGSGGGAVSVQDSGATLYFALSDADGQLVLDGSGNPVFVPEVLPPAALPIATTAAFGAVKPDGNTLSITAGVLATVGQALDVSLSTDQTLPNGVYTKVTLDTVNVDTQGAWSNATRRYTPKAGLYMFIAQTFGRDSVAAQTFVARIVKNNTWPAGTSLATGAAIGSSVSPTVTGTTTAVGVARLNGTDFVELDCFFNSTGTNAVAGGTGGETHLVAIYLGP